MHKVFFIAMVVSLLSIGGYWYAHHISLASPVAEPVSFGSIGAKETKNPDIINNPKIMNATLHTNKGDIKLEFSSLTPNTVANFIKLSKSGFYDGVKFHRVISGFMIQAGDPLSKDDTKKDEWGTGGPGYRFEDEIAEDNSNIIGSVAMANAGPDTNGSQFFINTADNHFLDDKHTVFAHVVEGMDVVKMIESIPKDEKDRPLEPVIIENITL